MSIPCLYLVRVCSVVSPCFWFIMGCYTANLRSKHGFGMALLCRDGLLILYNNVFLFASFYVFKKKFVLDCFHLQRFKLNLVLFFKKIVSIVWIVLWKGVLLHPLSKRRIADSLTFCYSVRQTYLVVSPGSKVFRFSFGFWFFEKKLSKIFGSKTIKFLPLHPLSKKSESDQIAIFDRIT